MIDCSVVVLGLGACPQVSLRTKSRDLGLGPGGPGLGLGLIIIVLCISRPPLLFK